MSGYGWAMFGTGVFVVLLGFWLGTRPYVDASLSIPVMIFVAVGLAWIAMGVLMVQKEQNKKK